MAQKKLQKSEFVQACELLRCCIATLECGCTVDDVETSDYLASLCKRYIKIHDIF